MLQKNKGYNAAKIVLFSILFIELAGWIYVNFYRMYRYTADDDAAKLLYHTIQMWESKKLIIPDWVYMTTGEWDCASLPALLLYGLTKDIYLSFGISNILNLLLYGTVIFGIFHYLKIEKLYACMAVAFVWLPFDWGMLSYSNMLFYMGAQYVYKVLLPLWLILLYLQLTQSKSHAVLAVSIIGFFILVAATGTSSGVYVLLCGFAPVFFCRLTSMIISSEKTGGLRSLLKNRGNKNTAIFTLSVFIFYLLSLLIRHFAGVYSRVDSMTLRLSAAAQEGISDNFISFTGVMKLFPDYEVTVISVYGIQYVLKTALFFILLWFSLRCLPMFLNLDLLVCGKTSHRDSLFVKNNRNKNSDLLRAECITELISIFVWNYLVLQITAFNYPRYHLIGFIPLAAASFIVFGILQENSTLKTSKSAVTIFISLLLFASATALWLNASGTLTTETYDSLMQISQTAENNNAETVVFIDDTATAEQLRLYDASKKYLTYSTSNNVLLVYDQYKNMTERANLDDRNMIVTLDEQFEVLPEYIRNSYQSTDTIISGYTIYISDRCRLDSLAGLSCGLEYAIDYAQTPGYVWRRIEQKDASIFLQGNGSDFLLSPYLASCKNGYKITIYLQQDDSHLGTLDIIAADGSILQSFNLNGSEQELTVEIPADTEIRYKLTPSDGSSLTFIQAEFQAY